MRRRRPMLLGVAALFLFLCCALAVGTGVFFGLGHPCVQGNHASSITVLQGQKTGDIRACGGSVTVLGHVTGDVEAYGGGVTVAGSGHVDGNVRSYGGPVEIAGKVGGDVTAYGGGVRLDSPAWIQGDVTAYGGEITKASGARVDGEIQRDQSSGHGMGGPWFFDPLNFGFPVFNVIIGGLLAFILVRWAPQRTLRVGEVMFGSLPRSLAIGALSWVLGLILAVILALTIIGIPVTIVIVLALIAGWAVGTVATGWLIGRVVLQRISSRERSPVIEAVVGTIILALLESIPLVGGLLNLFIAVLGVGAIFLSHFGARRWGPPGRRRWAA